MLNLQNVTKKFTGDLFTQDFVAVNDLSFNLKTESVTGFLGANGAGKTTTLKMIMDFIRPSSGDIVFDSILGTNQMEIFRNIGFLPERPYFYPNLTGREFCHYLGKVSGMNTGEIKRNIDKWAPIFKIEFALDRTIKNYSKGMLQRVGFLVTLLHDPKLIILDEPLSGLDPIGRKELKSVIKDINNEGKTVFFSSHIVSDVEEVCSDVIFIKNGSLFYEGSVDKIIRENSKNDFTITAFDSNDLKHIFEVNLNEKDKKISSLMNEGFSIYSIEEEKPTLEEIVYEVKSK